MYWSNIRHETRLTRREGGCHADLRIRPSHRAAHPALLTCSRASNTLPPWKRRVGGGGLRIRPSSRPSPLHSHIRPGPADGQRRQSRPSRPIELGWLCKAAIALTPAHTHTATLGRSPLPSSLAAAAATIHSPAKGYQGVLRRGGGRAVTCSRAWSTLPP
jgi:hypothetical protein